MIEKNLFNHTNSTASGTRASFSSTNPTQTTIGADSHSTTSSQLKAIIKDETRKTESSLATSVIGSGKPKRIVIKGSFLKDDTNRADE